MATGSLVSSGPSLLRWAKETSKPKVNKPTSSEALDKHCLKKKWCVLIFTAVSTPSDVERASISKLAKAHLPAPPRALSRGGRARGGSTRPP